MSHRMVLLIPESLFDRVEREACRELPSRPNRTMVIWNALEEYLKKREAVTLEQNRQS